MMPPIRVVLVDDHALFRGGLRGMIDGKRGCRVVAEYSDGAEYVAALPSIEADVVLMDISMPSMNGDEATLHTSEQRSDIKVVCLSMFGQEPYYRRMIDAGAKGFLLKDSSIDEVFAAIECVAEGGTYICDALLQSLSNSMHTTAEHNIDPLTDRERDILVYICQGLSTQDIADKLFISKRTVDTHRANILEKTGCHNTASLVVYAIKCGIAEL